MLTLGQGDTGQLGLGGGILERVKPGHVDLEPNIKQAVAGGMHTVCLTDDGEVDFLSGCAHYSLSIIDGITTDIILLTNFEDDHCCLFINCHQVIVRTVKISH